MTVPVWVEQQNGTFTASVLGAPHLRGEGPTKEAAVSALTVALSNRMDDGKLILLNVPIVGVSGLAASHKDDPYLQEIVEETYRYRDELKRQEFPE